MVKNIVFDLGGVLIDFKPEIYLARLGYGKEKIELYTKTVFWGKEWYAYNASKYDAKETEEILVKHYPEFSKDIQKIFQEIDYQYILFEMPDTVQYLKELKEQDKRIYVLSDLSEDSYNYNKKFDFFHDVEGGVYSFKVGTTKPDKKNYETLLETYNLIPEETIFIDDNITNVEAANELGIRGVHFTTLEEVKQKVDDIQKELANKNIEERERE